MRVFGDEIASGNRGTAVGLGFGEDSGGYLQSLNFGARADTVLMKGTGCRIQTGETARGQWLVRMLPSRRMTVARGVT